MYALVHTDTEKKIDIYIYIRARVFVSVCMYVILYSANGHGRLWRLIAAGRNTEVFHDQHTYICVYITIVSALFALENVGAIV